MAPVPPPLHVFGLAIKPLTLVALVIVLYFAALAVWFRWLGRRP